MGVTMLETKRDGSLMDVLAHKWRMFRLVQGMNGWFAAMCEVFFACCKPILYGYTKISWWWYRTRGRTTVSILGNQLALHPQDKGVSIELAVFRVHEPRTTRLLAQWLKPGMTVIDIGCNIGYYALLEAQRVGPAGKVIAIEPEPENARLFLKNLQSNGYRNVVFHQVAISDHNGTFPLLVSEKSNRHSLSPVPWSTTNLQVCVCTLDSLIAKDHPKSVDLIRMDLEGHEVVVLPGMLHTIRRYSPSLLIEIHPDLIEAQAVVQWLGALKDLGYRPDWLFDQERDIPLRWRFLRPETPTMEGLMSDPRIHSEPKRPLMVLFSMNAAARRALSQAGSDVSFHGTRRQRRIVPPQTAWNRKQ
jgi:FkbM family methyltransferase